MKITTQEALSVCCKRWQEILRLQDWDIVLQLTTHPEDISEHCLGDSQVNIDHKRACIRIAHPDVAPRDWLGKPHEDQEKTLVHELLHLHFHPFCPESPDSLEYQLWEQAIDVLANTLVRVARVQAE